jgi:hypothetical protein
MGRIAEGRRYDLAETSAFCLTVTNPVNTMNTASHGNMLTSTVGIRRSHRHLIGTLVAALLVFFTQPLFAADEPGLTEKAKEAARETAGTLEKAGNTAADTAKDLWQRIDAARLKNRTKDELVAWVIMGVLVGVGAVAGMMTPLKPTGLGKLGRLGLGLVGAFIGGESPD